MRSGTVAVGCHRLRIGLFEPFSAVSHLPPVATGCARWAPQMLHPSPWIADGQTGFGRPAMCASSVQSFSLERGSLGQRRGLVATMNSCASASATSAPNPARPTSTRRRVHVTLGARMATVVWSILDEHELSLQVVALVPIPLPFALKATHDDARRNSNLAGEGPDLAVGR
jgi:hypothetical protein